MNKRGQIKFLVGFLFIALVIFSLYFVLAASTDNTKSYDSVTKTLTISSGTIDVAKIKLDTPQVYNVIRGKDRLVAEFTIENYVDSSNVFNNMEFYDLKDNNKKISRGFVYKYKVVTGTREIPYYNRVCSEVINSTSKKTNNLCSSIIAGYNKENIYGWKALDFNNLPVGKITIGIFTDVLPNDNIEWIPTLYGVKINEWASWNESFNNELIGYWGMDEGSGTKLLEYNSQINNATLIGNVGYGEGIHGSSTYYENVGDAAVVSDSSAYNFNPTDNFSISFWANKTTTENDATFIGKAIELGKGWFIFENPTATMNLVLLDAWGNGLRQGYASKVDSSGNLVHYVWTYDGSCTSAGMKLYVDGSLVTDAPSQTWDTCPTDPVVSISLFMGAALYSEIYQFPMQGSMDEVAIWNRTLSESEISGLYNNGEGIFYDIPYINQLIIVPSSPTADEDLQCNATLVDYEQTNLTANWGWYRNGELFSAGETQTYNGTNSLISSISNSNTSNGENWSCEVTPYNGEKYGIKRSVSVLIPWQISFNVTDSSSNISRDNVLFNCNQTGFSQLGDTTNPYGPYNFTQGNYQCGFEGSNYYNKTIVFTADNDKIINVLMSYEGAMTPEEHMWMEWLYNCWRYGECKALLENINQSIGQVWDKLIETNRAVVTQEVILSDTLSSEQNISINYTISIPYKDDVAINELLPIRLYFWFTDEDKTYCYSQDKGTDTNRAESPYCLPLVAEVLGPNNGSINFQVDLKPALEQGTYGFVRSIEVDPKGIWTQYGRENIGEIKVLEGTNKPEINLIEKAKMFAKSSGITGAITGLVQTLLSGWQIVIIIAIAGLVLIVFIISRTKIKLKKM